MPLSYNIVSDDNGASTTVVFSTGDVKTVSDTHPNYAQVRSYLLDTPREKIDESHIRGLINVVASVGDRLRAISDRARISGSTLFFDGDPLDNALSQHIVRLVREEDEAGYRPLIAFLEKVSTNPSEDSRTALYTWLRDRNFTITVDGDFVAYKGVAIGTDDVSISIHSGTAIVNGVVHKGQIPNPDGGILEMARASIDSNTSVGCSVGLHAGTWEYASNFAQGRVLVVHINPRDVVSVPSDCQFQKLRVSRYRVISTIARPIAEATSYNYDDDFDEDGYDEFGYDEDGFDSEGYDEFGFDEDGFDSEGYDEFGFDEDGFDVDGYNSDGNKL